ncbi:MAG TPA: SusD/RagB family nutrient-binding outer membrane lipoprotein [Gemmatimonadales bacterium]|nr:SusD/RagB family nutrient-binding outer membrane lipoprotein [Gemmatimonadales bacterium]
MRKHLAAIALALGLGLGSSACSDFLTGPKLSDNPNRPTVANNANLLVSAETNLSFQSESHLARTICIWMQQCAGTNKQYLSLGLYITGDDDYYYDGWIDAYTRGGLLDLRRIQHDALQVADSAYAGVAYVLEAWLMGQTSDVWGDIPYSQAADSTVAHPAPDPQQRVYETVQAKLDTAIIFLNTTTAPPGGEDLVYEGDVTKWAALANTLKARFYLHTAERDPTAYQKAFTAASSGITDATGAGDYLAYHSSAVTTENNIWHQFVAVSWPQYLSAGKFLVDTLNALADPRISQYFAENSDGVFVGAAPGQNVGVNPSELSETRLDAGFRQPFVTYVENELILAEAAFRIGDASAGTHLNNARTAQGLTALVTVDLPTIMLEKYIALFQNMEVWNDYKRTCLPDLTPATGASQIPVRLVYPLSERTANPSISGAGPARNWNDPNPC